jgi:hypothetical protein
VQLGYLVTHDCYDVVRAYVRCSDRRWLEQGAPVEVSDLVKLFPLLSGLRTVEVKCAVTNMKYKGRFLSQASTGSTQGQAGCVGES